MPHSSFEVVPDHRPAAPLAGRRLACRHAVGGPARTSPFLPSTAGATRSSRGTVLGGLEEPFRTLQQCLGALGPVWLPARHPARALSGRIPVTQRVEAL